MRLLFVGPLWDGSTSLQRFRAFQKIEGVVAQGLDSFERVGKASLVDRMRHRLRCPADRSALNARLLEAVERFCPDLVFIDGTRVLTSATLRGIKSEAVRVAFYSPDDVSARHNSSRQLEGCDGVWDVFFTTKSFNVEELRSRGVKRPVLIGNSFDPDIHRPMASAEVGDEFESFDAVFAGVCESPRLKSINQLAEAGVRVVVYGNGWSRRQLNPAVTLKQAAYSIDYTRALHTGRIALCFLRKMNRDQVTTRSIEIPASGRVMLAENTVEHDHLFDEGREYVSFSSDAELVRNTHNLLANVENRTAIARAGRERCLSAGYSTLDRARDMLQVVQTVC